MADEDLRSWNARREEDDEVTLLRLVEDIARQRADAEDERGFDIEQLRVAAGERAVLPPADASRSALATVAELFAICCADEFSSAQLSAIWRACERAGSNAGYADIVELHDDCGAALHGHPLLHASGGIGRIHGYAGDSAARRQALAMSVTKRHIVEPPSRTTRHLVILAAILLLLVWFLWLTPRLYVDADLIVPGWATASGQDEQGRWVELAVDKQQRLRFRLVRPQVGEPFWIADREITRLVWQSIMGEDAGHFTDRPQAPIDGVSQQQARAFCQRLNALCQDLGARLPARDEWLVALHLPEGPEPVAPPLRLGRTHELPPPALSGEGQQPQQIWATWLAAQAAQRERLGPQPLGSQALRFNHRGVADLCGNLAEWCRDAAVQPDGSRLVLVVGGSWADAVADCNRRWQRWQRDVAGDPRYGFRIVVPATPGGRTDIP